MSEITNIQSKVQKWLNSERGKQYKKSSPQELLSILAQENVLTPAEINTLKSASVFTSKYKMSINNNSSLEGWGIEQKNPNKTDVDKQLETRLNNVKKELDAKVKENRFLRSAWHWAKNKIGFGANSNKVEQAIENERKKISQIKNPEVFMELTGAEYTDENYEKLIKGEIKLKSEQALEAYKQGQDGVVDFAADMASGIAAVGIYTVAVAAAPFTGGASIAVGFAAAAASGAVIKTGLKAGAALISGKEYTKEDLKHDAITGGFSGALGPLTGGMGGAVGKSVATKLGIQALKEGAKDIAANTAKTGFKQWAKTALVNPAGYKYVGGKAAQRAVSFGAEAMTDGALGGALDGGFRAGYENDWDGGAILEGTVSGGVGGAMMAPAIGGGMKLSGKVGQKFENKINMKDFFAKFRKQSAKGVESVNSNAFEKYKDYVLPNKYKMTPEIVESLEKDEELTIKVLSKFVGIPENVNIIGKKNQELTPEMRLTVLQLLDECPDNMYPDRGTYLSIMRLAKLKHTDAAKYNEIVDSGILKGVIEQKFSLTGAYDITEHNVIINHRLLEVSKEFKQQGSCVTTLRTAEELSDISKYVKDGEVGEFNGVLYVNNDGKAEKLNLSREKFEQLFPDIESNSFIQGKLGDCWLVSFLDALMDKPKGRTTIYKMFEQQGNDIIVHLKDVDNAKIIFKDGNVLYSEYKYLGFKENNQALGLQMIEQSIACGRMGLITQSRGNTFRFLFGKKMRFNDYPVSECASPDKLMSKLEGGQSYEMQTWMLGINSDYNFIHQGSVNKKSTQRKLIKMISEKTNDNKNIICVHFIKERKNKKIFDKYNLYGNHAYTIKAYNPSKQTVYISNPHNVAVVKEIPLNEILDFIEVGCFKIP